MHDRDAHKLQFLDITLYIHSGNWLYNLNLEYNLVELLIGKLIGLDKNRTAINDTKLTLWHSIKDQTVYFILSSRVKVSF